MDQGSVTYHESHTRAETDAHARGVAEAVVAAVDCRGTCLGPIDLGASSSVGRFLENGCIFSVCYATGSLPDDGALFEDLRTFKALYEDALAALRGSGQRKVLSDVIKY